MLRRKRERRGFALLIVLLLMAMGSALIFASLSSTLADADVSHSGTAQRHTLVGAESELWRTVVALDAESLRAAPLGPFAVTSHTLDDMTLLASVDKVDTSVVWVVAIATIQHSGAVVARHRLGMSVLIPRDSTDHTLHPVPERAWVDLF